MSRAPLRAGVALTLTIAVATGCSNDRDSGTGGNGGGSGNASAEVQQAVDDFLQPPTSIDITEPLSRKPDEGKRIVVVESTEPTSLKTDEGLAEAIQELGWTLEVVQEGTGPEDPAKAFDAAIDMAPDAILISGNPLATMRTQVERAKAANIVVLQSDSGEPVGQDGSVYTLSLDSFDQTQLWGQMIADYVAVDGSKRALIVDLSLYPILHAFSEGAQQELEKVAPDTEASVMDVQIQDFIAGSVPGQIVSEIQRNPDTDFIILSLGDMATGLDAALRAAGLDQQVRVGGESAGLANIEALRDGTQHVFTGFAALIHGWQRADALARIFNGDPLDPNLESTLPTQLITQDNVDEAPLDDEGYYVGVEDFRDQFKELWQLTG
ncbi:sugar ABC transporter substrate-binding protein [Geodermatophilus sp. URMC 64]